MSAEREVFPAPSTPFPEPIAITGIGCRLPGGHGPKKLFQLLLDKVDAIKEVPADRWDWRSYFDPEPGRPGRTYARWGGFIDGIDRFDPRPFGLSAREAPHMDPQQRLLLEAAWEALEDAGEPIQPSRASSTGVFVGISTNDYNIIQARTPEVDPYTTPGTVMSIAANRISYCLNLTGPSVSIDTACSSSLVAANAACRALASKECERAIVAGVNCLILPYEFVAFSSMTMLAKDGRCRAFDAKGSGFVRAEGVGAIVLKPLSAAIRAGDRIYALIRATGVNQDGRTPGMTVPSEEAQEALVRQVCAQAGVAPAEVRYVEAHGTGTPVGDPIEARALGASLSEGRRGDDPCRIGSVKTNIGHLEAGAGIAGLIKLALALHHDCIPASLHFETPNPAIDFERLKLRVITEAEPFGSRAHLGGINSFGFGGTNGHALLEGPPRGAITPFVDVPGNVEDEAELLVLSARSEPALKDAATALAAMLRGQTDAAHVPLAAVAAALARRRGHLDLRLAVTGTSSARLAEALASYARNEPHADFTSGSTVKDAKLVFVYSGQGPQWWGMGRELYDEEPVFRASIEASHAALEKAGGWPLIDEMLAEEAASNMRDTGIAQPAIFALQTALTALWRSYGIEAAAVVGHSVGEVAAAHEAGIYSLEDAMRVIYHRGRTMSRAEGGRMLAAGIGASEAERFARQFEGKVYVAALNSPASVTLSGDGPALQQVAKELDAKGLFARFLQVPYAFHSAQMDPVREELLRSLEGLRSAPPRIPFASTVTGDLVDASTDLSEEYWWRNVRQTVRFSPAISRLGAEGYTHFLEVGPHPVLAGSVKECLSSRSLAAITFPSLRRGSPERQTILGSLGALHTFGHPADLAALYSSAPHIDLPGYFFQHETFWAERPESRRARLSPPKIPLAPIEIPAATPTFEGRLDPKLHPWLSHHAIQGRPVFPGAGYLELALGAARELGSKGTLELEDVELEKALFLPPGDEVAIIQLATRPDESTFEVHARMGSADAFTRHALGKVRATETLERRVDRAAIEARLPDSFDPLTIYSWFEERGLDFGSSFRTIRSGRRARGEALGRIELTTPLPSDLERHEIHPALLDGCLQVVDAALADDESLQLPVSFERVRFHGLGESRSALFAHATIRAHDATGTLADVLAFDEAGRVCLEVIGFRTHALGGARDALGELAYELSFRPVPLETEHPERPFELRASDLAARLSAFETATVGMIESRKRAAERLSAHVSALLRRASLATGSTGARLPASLSKLHDRPGLEVDLAASEQSLIRDFPGLLSELSLFERASHQLESLSRGEPPAFDLTKPGALSQALESAEAMSGRMGHHLVARALRSLVESLPEGRRLSVLIVGGRTGAIATRALPQLPPEFARCTFTDTDERFFPLAEPRLRDFPFVTMRALDLEGELDFESLGLHDLVIADEALGRSARSARAIHSLRQLLAPGGLLLAIEQEARDAFDELLSCLTGARAPVDDPFRPAGPLLDRAAWASLLTDAGFQEVSVAAASPAPGPVLLVAKSPPRQLGAGVKRPGSWLVFADSGGFAPALAKRLAVRGQSVTVIRSSASGGRTVGRDDFTRALDTADLTKVDGIVTLAALDSAGADSDLKRLSDALLTSTSRILGLSQALAARGAKPPLWIVTRSALPAGCRPRPVQLTGAAVIGLARTVANELPGLGCRVVDLGDGGDLEVERLADELLFGGDQDELALRQAARYAPRLVRRSLERPRTHRSDVHELPARLVIDSPGSLDGLSFRSIPRTAPGPREVEVQVFAGALNFRDVMKALAIYPGDAPDAAILGDEGSGRIARVGSEVTSVAPGDEVIGIGGGYFGGFVTVHECFVVKKPKQMSFEEAATTPVAYMTARYALHDLGRIRGGEKVLVHAGTGGVGLAAIQLAHSAGAEVYATAGTPEKRAFLERLGVKRVMDSRTLEFAEQVRADTGGRGVDLVLNSLAGEAIEKSLSVLGPRGRFLEIGKRDIYGNTKIGLRPFRNSLSYFAIDLGASMVPDFVRPLLDELIHDLSAGRFRPLPYKTHPVGSATEAFREMTQARQIGKLVLAMGGESVSVSPSPPALGSDRRSGALTRELCRPDGAYVVTGGTGGFGLATAEWLTANGAGRLLLLSRSGPRNAEALGAIDAMRARGVDVQIERVDVSDEESLRKSLEKLRAAAPIRGIVHSAMVLDDAIVTNLDERRLGNVLRPKAVGAYLLDALTRDDPLDFFVLYSSVSSVIGNAGQGSYAAANAFLDALAHERKRRGAPGLAVNFGPLAEVGVVTRDGRLTEHFDRIGFRGLSTRTALRSLGRLIREGATEATVIDASWEKWAKGPMSKSPRLSELASESGSSDGPRDLRQLLAQAPGEELARVESFLRDQVGAVLRAPSAKLDRERPLTELGLDSLMAVELMNRVESQVGVSLPTGKFLGGASILRMSQVLLELLVGTKVDPVEASTGAAATRSSELEAECQLPAELRFPAFRYDAYRLANPRGIFVTGPLELIGAHILDELASATDARLYALVTASDRQAAERALRARLGEIGIGGRIPVERLIAIVGDLESPKLGLTDSELTTLAESIDVIVHNGARVNHVAPYSQLAAANVRGTIEVLKLASLGAPKPVHFVSGLSSLTAHLCRPDEPLLETDPLLASGRLAGGYAQSRWVAEKLVGLASSRGLPVTTYRPGLLLPDVGDAGANVDDLAWRALKACVDVKGAPAGGWDVFLTPVSYVRKAFAQLMLRTEPVGRTYHLVPEKRSSLADLSATLRGLGYDVPEIPREEWEARVKATAAGDPNNPLLPYVMFLPQDVVAGLSAQGGFPPVSSAQARKALTETAIACPDVAPLLSACVRRFMETRAWPRASAA
ncbi:MAG: thioester reductase domain-containing protein [Deltaproteobacteria bacterium]|nr:thioester reductase domain-containing protein [Deltaproteobacteria bacterium]